MVLQWTDSASDESRLGKIASSAVRPAAFRDDIQGLRGVSILAVLLCHIWPGVLPGGFVGVDVFFVISGYLITGLLFRELQQTGRISLLAFYSRRAKRLLPAATLVLIVITLATPLIPPSQWYDTSIGTIASALFVENWHLAWLATDYFGAENPASPTQHYWSLSIEEQFYLVWPVLMIAAGGLALGSFRRRLIAVLATIIALSFAASVWLTQTNPDAAYFVTHTRVWELGLGGLLAVAVLPEFSSRMRDAMRAGGLLLILFSAVAFSSQTAFPGYAALLPTLGCGLVLAAGQSAGSASASWLLASRPAQYLGDISYSLYLWHWPLIIFFGFYVPGGIGAASGLALIVVAVALAGASKRFVEDPIRHWRLDGRAALGLGAVSAVCCITAAALSVHYFGTQLIRTYDGSPDYPGAQAFLAGHAVPEVDAPMPPLNLLRKDKAPSYKLNCHLGWDETALNPCFHGVSGGPRIVLIGDSHAANWMPALIALAEEGGWSLETHTKSACPLLKSAILRRDKPYLACLEWGDNLRARLRASPPDLVILAQHRFHRMAEPGDQPEQEASGAAVAEVWGELRAMGVAVIAMRGTPVLREGPAECIQRDPACAAEQSDVMGGGDPILVAHSRYPEVPVIDMTDALCRDGKCPMIIGNLVVWRDDHHLTASYSRSMAPTLKSRIASALGEYPRKADVIRNSSLH